MMKVQWGFFFFFLPAQACIITFSFLSRTLWFGHQWCSSSARDVRLHHAPNARLGRSSQACRTRSICTSVTRGSSPQLDEIISFPHSMSLGGLSLSLSLTFHPLSLCASVSLLPLKWRKWSSLSCSLPWMFSLVWDRTVRNNRTYCGTFFTSIWL